MPKPQGTYLKTRAQDKNAHVADESKKTVASAKALEHARFFQALDRVGDSQLRSWHNAMRTLADAIKKSEPLSKDGKVRKAVADVMGEVRKLLTQVKDLKSLESTLEQPARVVIRAPRDLGPAGAELALVIALVRLLEILVRLRGDKTRR